MASSVDKQRLRFCRRCIVLTHGANSISFEVRTDLTWVNLQSVSNSDTCIEWSVSNCSHLILCKFGKTTFLFPYAYCNHTWRSAMGLGLVLVTAHQFSVMPYRKLQTLIWANHETMAFSVDKQRLRFCRRCIILKHGANNTSFEVRTD